MRWGLEVTGALPSGIEISNGIKEQDQKSVFEVENTSRNSQSTSPSCSMAEGVHPGSCTPNVISRRCGGSRAQTRKNEERWPGFNRSSSNRHADALLSPKPGGGQVTHTVAHDCMFLSYILCHACYSVFSLLCVFI